MDEPESLKFRITKKAYVFDIKKRYENVKGFLAGKKHGGPLPGSQFFAAKKGREKGGKMGPGPQEEKKQTSGFLKNTLLIAGLIVLGLAGLFLWILFSSGGSGPAPLSQSYTPWFQFQPGSPRLMTFGESGSLHTAYIEVPFDQKDLKSAVIRARVFSSPAPEQVFILDTRRQQAESYPEFRSSLQSILSEKSIPVAEVSYSRLRSLPQNVLLIIPSGYFPQSLLSGDFTYKDLLAKGTVIVYIGLPMDRLLSDSGSPVSVSSEIQGSLPFSFSSPRPSSEGFRLFDPQYSLSPRERGGSTSIEFYGSASGVQSGSGYFVALPQTLDGGWRRNGTIAAEDIARLVVEAPWQSPFSTAEQFLELENTTSGTAYLRTTPFAQVQGFASISFEGTSPDGQKVFQAKGLTLRDDKNSELYVKGGNTALPTYLTGQKIRLVASLSEPSGSDRPLFLQTVEGSETVKTDKLQEGPTNLQSPVPFDYDSSLPPGEYILQVVDSTGKSYAQTLLAVEEFQAVPLSLDFKKGNFTFSFSSSSSPLISFAPFTATVDGKYSPRVPGGEKAEIITPPLDPGPHTFSFEFEGGFKKETIQEYVLQKQFYDNPLVIFLAIVAIGLFAAGTYFRRPEKQLLVLDIPDFPPISKIRIPVKKAAVLSLFDQLNRAYAWQYMPLSLSELKGGFRKLNYNGNPITIGDYNLERLLFNLEKKSGEAREVLGLWGLRRWEQESGRSLHNLAVFRHMRDVFVNKAVRFSRPEGAAGGPDAKISISHYPYYAYIYEGDSDAARALSTLASAQSILVFGTDDELSSFTDRLTSGSPLAIRVKLEVESQRLFLVSLNGLAAFLDSKTI